MNTETKDLSSISVASRANDNIELLCPAGNRESLFAALLGGANAVYLGVDSFNARRNAQNFTLQSLPEICDLTHLAGAKLYLTLNTAILPSEFNQVIELARQAWYLGVDALIVADLGLLDRLHREQPQIELHVSTQTNVQSSPAVELLAELGADRVTLSRELSLTEISRIANIGIDLEVFAHGALCFSYSGQCLMSSLLGCRSANRGLCAQPCRLPYRLIDTSSGRAIKTPGDYLLSTSDLLSLEMLPELLQANVKSLKIEGRMRKANYVFAAAKTYSQAIKTLLGSSDQTCQNDGLLYSQRGFTSGYLGGHRDNSIMDFKRHNTQATASAAPQAELDSEGQLFSKNSGFVKIKIEVYAFVGEPLRIQAETLDGKFIASLDGPIVEEARNKAITEAEIQEHVGRVGSTPFSVQKWQIELGDNAGIGFSTLHKLRSAVLEELSQNILAPWHSRVLPPTAKHQSLPAADRGKVQIAALVYDSGNANIAVKAGAQKVYYHSLGLETDRQPLQAADLQKLSKKVEVVAFMPTIAHDSDLQKRTDFFSESSLITVNNLGELHSAVEQGITFEIGPNLPAYNLATLELYARLGAKRVWLGPELSYKDLEKIALNSPLPLSLTISGSQELMISEHCLFMAEGPCDQNCLVCKRRRTPKLLEDRKNYRFPVRTDDAGRSHIYNAVALDLLAELPKLVALGISEFVVDCTLLSNQLIEDEVSRAVRAKDLAVRGAGQLPKREGRTTGHLFRGVL